MNLQIKPVMKLLFFFVKYSFSSVSIYLLEIKANKHKIAIELLFICLALKNKPGSR
jgi:hypothetical protein